MTVRSFGVCIALVLILLPSPARSQSRLPARPRLEANADSNDAESYYDLGLAAIDNNPERAADAFFWAARLNPTWAEPYYARRVALLLQDTRRLVRYLNEEKDVIKSKEIQHLDSLYFYALTLNPFVYQKLDLLLFNALIKNIADEETRRGQVTSTEVQYWIDNYISQDNPELLAWRSYAEGRFDDALRAYSFALSRARNHHQRAQLRTSRARIFFQLNKPDSALPQLIAALDELRKTDKKDIVYIYESKALLEQAIGMTQERLGNTAAAREAFAMALQEDLSYFSGHVQLAMLALDAKDPVTATSEMDLAVQIRGDDPGLRYLYGFTLGMISKPKDAEVQLRKAIELDPVYAAPHEVLAEALEAQQRPKEALGEYRQFLALAPNNDPRRSDVEARVKELSAASTK